jgi:NDP-sugar pyrophosphorylase family protein
MNGDVLMKAKIRDMVDYHHSHGAEVTVGVKMLDTPIPFGVMTLDGGRITSMEEKPTYRDYVNTGVYVIEPQVLKEIPPNQRFDMPELISSRLGTDRALAFPLHETWMDMGRPDDLEQARLSFDSGEK